MNDTLDYILEALIGLTVGGVGMYFLTRRQSRRLTEALTAPFPTPPCSSCGKPTGSPRLTECNDCHKRRILAEFDAAAAESQRRIDATLAELRGQRNT